MHDFRLYVYGDSCHIVGVILIRAKDDEEAVAQAQSQCIGQRLELWQLARKVRVFEGRPIQDRIPLSH